MKLKVGVTYEKTLEWPLGTVVTFVCLSECISETARFKMLAEGYRFLVLSVVGETNSVMDYKPGEIRDYPGGAHFFTKLRRLG